MNYEDKFFSTKDFYLACFLKTKNIKLVKVNRENTIVIFVFEKDEHLEELITNFYANKETVPANNFINSIRDLKALVHNIK